VHCRYRDGEAGSPERSILICGTIGMAFGHLLMFLSFTFGISPLFTLMAMLVPTGAFTLTLAPLSWVVLSEIFPNRVRGKAMSLATCAMFASSEDRQAEAA
jgi:MFS family permease